MVTERYADDGFVVFPKDQPVLDWAQAAHVAALEVLKAPGDLRHGKTWRVGVDELPNAADGSIGGVALRGRWEDMITSPARWHQAQLSVVYPGYPGQDPTDSDAAYGYRLRRDAAHVDGLLPEGPDKRRHLREPHAFVLGLPLNDVQVSPLVVWRGSHRIMQAACATCFADVEPDAWGDVDVTEVYQAARREVFASCERIEVPVVPGQATLVHRHLLHGVAPWPDHDTSETGRMIAYFRPLVCDVRDWL